MGRFGLIFSNPMPATYGEINIYEAIRGAFVYRNGLGTELPECTTGMDFYMWFCTFNAYHMHGVCLQWPIAATEDEDHAF